jgi:histidine phosphotransferase ChpT
MGEIRTSAAELAQRLADRLCHDIAGSIQAVASGLDLLAEASTPAMRDEAAAFLAEAVAAQKSRIGFARQAFGASAAPIEADELRRVAEDYYAGQRAGLEWSTEIETLGPTAARALLNLVQIAAEALPLGGLARVTARRSAEGVEIAVTASSPRVSLREETRAGLAGEPFDAGLSGRWVQGAFVSALVEAAGGHVGVTASEGEVVLRVSLPADA